MKRVNYFLPLPMIEKLQRLAEKSGISVSEIIRMAIAEYLERKEKKA